MTTKINPIKASDTWEIRHKVMWPTESIDFIKLPADKEGLHYGLFVENELISVISLFIKGEQAQFRKFATLVKHQGQGYGSQLLHYIIGVAQSKGLSKIWCNARVAKMEYYIKFGMIATTKQFSKKEIDYVVMERNF